MPKESKALHPFNSILFFVSVFFIGRLPGYKFLLILLFFSGIFIIFRENFSSFFKKKLLFIFFVFFVFYFFANYSQNSVNTIKSGLTILAKMFFVLFLTRFVIRNTYPEDFLYLLKRINAQKLLLTVGIAFNLFPYFENIFSHFYIKLKNTDKKVKKVFLILKSPYIILSYSLVLIDDLYRGMLARNMRDFFVSKKTDFNAQNRIIFVLTLAMYLSIML